MKDEVFLTSTDTTIGFLSQNAAKLDSVKKRDPSKHYITAVDSLKTLKNLTRVPKRHKKMLRRARLTTFVMPNGRSYRQIKDKQHLLLIKRLSWAYTTSANISSCEYDEQIAKKLADVIIYPLKNKAKRSTILKLGKNRVKKIRN